MNECKIGIIAYGCGNIRSVTNSLQNLGYQSGIVNDPHQLEKFEILILPGVGSFEFAISKLHENDFVVPIRDWISAPDNKLIGICLGMQLLCSYSEEASKNYAEGLGLIDASVKKLTSSNYQRLPNIGWSEVEFSKDPFLTNSGDYYFVHSYGVFCEREENELAYSMYGDTKFSSSIQKKNIIGFQFHPEKSHKKGQLLINKVLNL